METKTDAVTLRESNQKKYTAYRANRQGRAKTCGPRRKDPSRSIGGLIMAGGDEKQGSLIVRRVGSQLCHP